MVKSPRRGRPTNLALLILVPAAILSGLLANAIGLDWALDAATIHGALALAIALLAPWKTMVIRRGLAHRRPTRWTSLALLGLIAVTLISGLIHSTGLTDHIGPLTLMQIHIVLPSLPSSCWCRTSRLIPSSLVPSISSDAPCSASPA